ncbi:superantigen-like protein SSL4 [Staphylococcus aureus]|uniref:superantigen-like protein SSL4 n=1 Tax=Staphylococcus aureus TaxID=1280 RepID=UPI00069B7BB5|nr:superantigen-like protein SSL4 [Staphylococcus aureus]HDC9407174.1 superantigen-like protein SSL4 [Staphylococcus aureus]
MKIRTIAKASLALGLVTTGASIVTTQSANAEVASALKAGQLAKINVSSSAVTTTTQAVNAEQNRTANTEQASKSNTEKVSTSPSSSVETQQPQSPTTKQAQKEINPKYKDLRTYYTKPSLEFEKQFGFMLKPWTTVRFMNVIPDWFIYKIALVGKDDKKYKDGPYDNIDVFIVLEDNKYQLKKYSVGGITKTNSKKVDHKARISITKEDEKGKISRDDSEYKITKEEISLKELDFKLRKQLIEQHNLYGNIGSGTIVIKTKNGGKYTFELHKKLQEHRMADVIDGTSIDRIEVNLKSS